MGSFADALNYGIPFFSILICIEFIYGYTVKKQTMRWMDTIASLSSGITNITKSILGIVVMLIGYDFLLNHLGPSQPLQATWWMYLVVFVAKDFAGYWVHRWEHEINVLWNRHLVHHSSEEFNLACALRQSVSEIFSFIAIFYLPLAFVGIPTEVFALIAPIHLFAQFWYHTQHIGTMGILEKIIVTPSHHRVHHAINPIYLDKNYSQIFIVWDKLFGTYQDELAEETPVYGIKRPSHTWNPFLINFQHNALLLFDTIYTKRLLDKIRLWFMPTGWRPADVAERYPVAIIDNPEDQKKYDPKSSTGLKVWAAIQMVLSVVSAMFLFNHLVAINEAGLHLGITMLRPTLLYGLFVFLSIFSYTSLMDRRISSIVWETLRLIFGLSILATWDGWFTLGASLPVSSSMIAWYLWISYGISFFFVAFDFLNDSSEDVRGANLWPAFEKN
ncbi:MAG: sterol desaturase family protein [Chitinophagales bacterium]